MHPPVRDGFGAKPRTHRRKARQQFLAVAKKKRSRINKIRKANKQQLAHLERNLTSIDALIACGASFWWSWGTSAKNKHPGLKPCGLASTCSNVNKRYGLSWIITMWSPPTMERNEPCALP
jgi:hypothetical protein